MKEFIVTEADAGRRLDKFIISILQGAPSSFAYKMLRKKNIVLNDKKAAGSEILRQDDTVRFYLSDETFDKFSAKKQFITAVHEKIPPIVYEDDDVIIVDKPSGMLTQKAASDDVSLNDILRAYVHANANGTDESVVSFTPSVCNRLDRNTSGLVVFARTYRGARSFSSLFASGRAGKFYKCICTGVIDSDLKLSGRLVKDEKTNTVTVTDDGEGSLISTVVHPIRNNGKLTLAEIELITGKTHQIRAHLAHIGHPILGDMKYGEKGINSLYRQKYGIRSQLLVCDRLIVPADFELDDIAGRVFEISLPEEFNRVM